MYTRDDYIKDCYIAENGRGAEQSHAKCRKFYYECGRVEGIMICYPEFADKPVIPKKETNCAFINGVWYDADELLTEEIAKIGTIPERLSKLHGYRRRCVDEYISTRRIVDKKIEELNTKRGNDASEYIIRLQEMVESSAQKVIEAEQRIKDYLSSDEYKTYLNRNRKKSFWQRLFS